MGYVFLLLCRGQGGGCVPTLWTSAGLANKPGKQSRCVLLQLQWTEMTMIRWNCRGAEPQLVRKHFNRAAGAGVATLLLFHLSSFPSWPVIFLFFFYHHHHSSNQFQSTLEQPGVRGITFLSSGKSHNNLGIPSYIQFLHICGSSACGFTIHDKTENGTLL